ncbi:MAG: WhiB family transcriptional regulator [Intrasporangiaceae bacterium]|nr:WhiB family transcriptional regulator [Intrasporangiaceae bacterium]
MSWKEHAACKNEPVQVMFGPYDLQREAARRLCQNCPVVFECRLAGRDEPYGLWGGLPEGSAERRVLPPGAPRREPEPEPEPEPDPLPPAAVEPTVDPEDISIVLQTCAVDAGVTLATLLGRGRSRHVTDARQRAMSLLRDLGMSYPAIGRVLDRDHATVHAGVRRYQERVAA